MTVSKNPWLAISPEAFSKADALWRELLTEMMERLTWIKRPLKRIVEVGSKTGLGAGLLKAHYPSADIFATDPAYPMLAYAKEQVGDVQFLHAENTSLPFEDQSMDLLLANLILPWEKDAEKTLREWRRVLHPEGMMMFTSFGPDTLHNLRESLHDHILPDLIDMHHQGDALLKAKCVDPVMDVDYLSLQYQSAETCLEECIASGLLVSSEDLLEKLHPLKNAEGKWLLPFEIVYGHAAGTAHLYEESPDAEGVVSFPLSHLRRQARRAM